VTDQASDSENPRTAVIGQPVEDDGMTFVVKRVGGSRDRRDRERSR